MARDLSDATVQEVKQQRGQLEAELQRQLKFQRRWQTVSMAAYMGTTVGTLVCSSLATLAAAQNYSQSAAYLSASAVILIGIEKSLLFRERWKFHLVIYSELMILQNAIAASQIELGKAYEQFASVMKTYASSLPVSARE